LKSVSYDQKNVREGFAEGVRLWLTQPETLEAKAPKRARLAEDFADSARSTARIEARRRSEMTAGLGRMP
jgi:hypothetical protein